MIDWNAHTDRARIAESTAQALEREVQLIRDALRDCVGSGNLGRQVEARHAINANLGRTPLFTTEEQHANHLADYTDALDTARATLAEVQHFVARLETDLDTMEKRLGDGMS